jgi:hypothetical protein
LAGQAWLLFCQFLEVVFILFFIAALARRAALVAAGRGRRLLR